MRRVLEREHQIFDQDTLLHAEVRGDFLSNFLGVDSAQSRSSASSNGTSIASGFWYFRFVMRQRLVGQAAFDAATGGR